MSHIPFQSTKGFKGFLSLGNGLQKDAQGVMQNNWYQKQAGSDVDMNFWRIDNLSNPTLPQSGATKDYVDSNVWYNVQAQSDVDANNYKITNLGAPAQPQDATNKKYVESLAGTPPLKDQLRAYYTLDGDYKDSTTNNYDGTPITGTTFNNSTAIINQSLEFTSDSDKVDIGNAMKFGTGDFTVSFWVYPNTADTTRRNIISFDQNSGFFNIEYGYADTGVFRLYTNDSGGDSVIATSANYPPGQWFFVVVTRTGATGQIWVDAQKAVEGTIQSGNIASGTSFIGGNPPSGFIDECGAWNRLLSQQEILHLYNNGNGTQYLSTYDWYAVKQSNHVNMDGYRVSNLGEALQGSDAVDKAYVDSRAPMSQLYQGARAYYTLDGDYTDSIGSYDGTNNGTSFISGVLGQAIDTGGTGYVNVGSAFNWYSGDFTVGLWVYPKDDSVSAGVFLGNSTSGNPMVHLQYSSQTSGHFRFFTWDVDGQVFFETVNYYPPNRWYYVVFTRTGADGQIWVDGQLDNEGTVADKDIGSNNNGFIGDKANGVEDFNIDEVAVWTRVLTENEIKYLYHEGQGTNDFVSYDYTINYDVDMNQNQILNLGSAQTNSFTIGDDAVETYAPSNDYGVAMLHAVGDIVMIMYDVNANNTQFVHQFGSLFNDNSGADLTGTTGNDGTINISSNAGELHIENRSGSQTTVRLLVIF